MNILILSNADSCRSRIAQALLSSLGKGMKIYSEGAVTPAMYLRSQRLLQM
ncbi:hypothetical protein [Bacteroides fragilis]|uniref:hypothetical protein n=1 Tax=Bacteroides fragilis TaxID=817 RepID=UPI0022AABF38|nr:hypothetical protein [Bacteroides fragilis]MCZ2663451.1 hypothetical protein [Bacteroides fragilis]